MLHGFTTINFYVDDVAGAASWYREVLGIEPYFVRPSREDPAYVEFRVGDQDAELGLISSQYRPGGHGEARPAGAVMYWHVDDVSGAVGRLLELGATELEPPTPRGTEGWETAQVADPFGNILGLMYSPHFLELRDRRAAESSRD
ncbi:MULTISPECIES: VOC family protein [Actinomycetes]|uniref:VOC family protein n=2 Tax=Actinomycetes TaxID=1760 RepID=A0ABP6LMZ7_9MICC